MSKPRNTFRYTGDLLLHFEAFCHTFIVAHRRERLLAKHNEFGSLLHHALITRCDPRRYLTLTGSALSTTALHDILAIAKLPPTSVLFGGPHEVSDTMQPTAAALDHADNWGSALISMHPGQLAVYTDEVSPVAGKRWYLFLADPQLRHTIEQRLNTRGSRS